VSPATVLDKFSIFRSINYEPHPRQVEIHRSSAPVRVAACGTRFGKSTLAAAEAFAASVEPSVRPRRGWIVAPNYDLADKVYREITLIARSCTPELILKDSEHERLLVLRNLGGSFTEIRGKSAENPASLMGEGLDWCIVDEAARLRPDIWERYLMARLVDKRGWALHTSTPKGRGWYNALFISGGKDPRVEAWRCPTIDNPHIDREWLAAVKARVPQAIWEQEYEAAFLEGAGQVFRNVRGRALGEFAEPKAGETYFAGLDLAQTTDYTVLLVLDSARRVVHLERYNRIDWSLQVQRVRTTCERYNSAWLLVDSTGVGAPITEDLAEAGLRVEGYPFTQASKSALVSNLSMMLEKEQITLPRYEVAPDLIDELEAFEYSVTDAGAVKMTAPWGMHDDCVMSCALAAWSARDPGEFEVVFV